MGGQKLGVGMVGAGSWAKKHLDAWRENEFSVVMGIWNRTKSRADILADEYKIPRVYADLESLLQNEKINVVSISMPHSFHYPIAIAAIEAGKQVFCEKPLALNLHEAQDMLSQANAAGVKTGIQFRHRNDVVAMHMQEMVQSGKIGDLQYIELKYCFDSGGRDSQFPLAWRSQKSIAGAGALGDVGVYLIDMARWIAGEFCRVCVTKKTFIAARPQPDSTETGIVDNEDECNLIAEFDRGAHGFLRASRFYADRSIRVCGSLGELLWAPPGGGLFARRGSEEQFSKVPVPHPVEKRNMITQFVTNIRENTNLPPTFIDGVKAQEVIEAAMISADEKRWVNLPLL